MNYHISSLMMVILGLIVIWDLIWKGIALWRASQRKSKGWFVALLVINSAGVLPITYLMLSGGIQEGKRL